MFFVGKTLVGIHSNALELLDLQFRGWGKLPSNTACKICFERFQLLCAHVQVTDEIGVSLGVNYERTTTAKVLQVPRGALIR